MTTIEEAARADAEARKRRIAPGRIGAWATFSAVASSPAGRSMRPGAAWACADSAALQAMLNSRTRIGYRMDDSPRGARNGAFWTSGRTNRTNPPATFVGGAAAR